MRAGTAIDVGVALRSTGSVCNNPSPMTKTDSGGPWSVSDGMILIRPPRSGDSATLVAGRDAEWEKWMGPGSDDPRPTACIIRDGEVIGWVDHGTGQEWLSHGEVNVGYNVFASHRRKGYASRAVMLLLHRIAIEGEYQTASVVIDRGNVGSLRVAARARFDGRREMGKNDFLARAVPSLTYSDGVVTIRRLDSADVDVHLASIDYEQMRWLWLTGDRENWDSMTPTEQRSHIERGLREGRDGFGAGPKWTFAVDTATHRYVACIDCDLASPNAPAGEANIAYSCHPEHRGRRYVSRAVRLILRFVAQHTGAQRAYLLISRENVASLRVAQSVATAEPEPSFDDWGRPALRFALPVDDFALDVDKRPQQLPVKTP